MADTEWTGNCIECGPCIDPEYYPECGGAQLCPAHHADGIGIGRLTRPATLEPGHIRRGCR